ncbi:MAG: Uncharacterized protein XD74_0979 [Actinobacteria bacterium 66_15]|nr:MAG: Uncharacterized protein XD74_0979 [Actinobacteria bacterium 66_15]
MRDTLFIRLLNQNDKGEALARRIAALREGQADEDVYAVNPESFRQVPNTPFCYWVSERIRRLFKELPPFESDGRTVKVGLQTGDDFRFVRAWWEVPSERILDSMQWAVGSGQEGHEEKWTQKRIRDFQAWCRNRTYEGKRWVPFAKGGEYSPYYADIHLVVNWEKDGAETRNFVDPKTGKTNSRPQNTDYYFRPGLTWGDRTSALLSVRPWPSGGVFSVKGSAGFFQDNIIMHVCGLMNSVPFNFLLEMLVSAGSIARSYQVGIIGSVPFPGVTRPCADKVISAWRIKQEQDGEVETSHAFVTSPLLCVEGTMLTERAVERARRAAETKATLERLSFEINQIILDTYDFTEEERKAAGSGKLAVGDNQDSESDDDYRECGEEESDNAGDDSSDEFVPNSSGANLPFLTADLISGCVGVVLGRWDVRIAIDQSLAPKLPDPFDPLPVCPPGMLVGPDGLPAEPNRIVSEEWLRARPDANTLPPDGSVKNPTIPDSEYPIRISWEGVLVDDPGFNGDRPHRDDIVRRVREVFDLLWEDKSHEIEQEACDIIGVSDLRDYFRRPAGFFQDHLKRYSKSRRKAPIYWPLSTASGSYTIWLYYHRLNDQTIYAAVNKYVEPKISEVERGIGGIENDMKSASGRDTTRLTDRLSEARTFAAELRDLREELLRIAALPYKPDLNDGVIINAAPFHGLFRLRSWAKDTEDCWKKLAKGEYDWAHLAYTIWPDRVREVCKRDRSIAIAHGFEGLCEVEALKPGKKGGRGRRKKEAAG